MRALPLATLILLAPLPALAHPGHDGGGGFLSGVLHPILGPDHLLAMVAVGLWAGLAGGRAVWAWPAAFVAAMLAGGLAGAGEAALPVIEPLILASVVAVGAAAALMLKVPVWVALPVLAVFGLAHGYAHGLEGPGGAPYALGFVIATVALHGVGIAASLLLARIGQAAAARGAGAAVAVAGLWLAFAPAAEATSAAPDPIDDWIARGAQVHGGFGSLIAAGILVGQAGRAAAQPEGRFDLLVSYRSHPDAPCPCVIDGLQVATGTSLGQRTLVLDPEPAPDGAFGIATFTNRATGTVWRATIPMSVAPALGAANRDTTPRQRWDLVAAMPELFVLEQVE